MKKLRDLTICFMALIALASSAVAQQKARKPTIPRLGVPLVIKPGPDAQQKAGRPTIPRPGIQPSDVAVAIVAWGEQDRQTAEKVGQVLKPVVDAIASGAKLTKADAARRGRPADEPQKLQDWLSNVVSRSRQARKLMILAVQRGESGSSSARTDVKCPVCGSTQHEFCFRLLDYDKVELQDMPIEDPELTCLTFSNGTCYPPGCCGNSGSATGGPQPGGGRLMNPQRTVLVFIVGGNARSYTQEKQVLVRVVTEGVEEALRSPSRLVIKTKSTPP